MRSLGGGVRKPVPHGFVLETGMDGSLRSSHRQKSSSSGTRASTVNACGVFCSSNDSYVTVSAVTEGSGNVSRWLALYSSSRTSTWDAKKPGVKNTATIPRRPQFATGPDRHHGTFQYTGLSRQKQSYRDTGGAFGRTPGRLAELACRSLITYISRVNCMPVSPLLSAPVLRPVAFRRPVTPCFLVQRVSSVPTTKGKFARRCEGGPGRSSFGIRPRHHPS